MPKQSKESLRDLAVIAWQEECAQRASWADELRNEIKELLGTDCPVEVDLDAGSRPIAKVEELRFILSKQSENGVEMFKHLMLLSNCSRCGKDTAIDIYSLADLGRLLSALDKNPGAYCSRCISSPDGLKYNASPTCLQSRT
jgi:hypothetical protein